MANAYGEAKLGGRALSCSVALLLLLASSASSEALFQGDFLKPGIYSEFNEVRLGALAYDRGLFSTDNFSGVVINGEFLFASPNVFSAIGSPRPYLGFDFAIADDPIHFAYGGLNWDFKLIERLSLGLSLGGAVTTAENLKDPQTYKALGCPVLFHLGASVGYDLSEKWVVQAYADHFSNARLCGEKNNGAEATGIRIGYRF